MNIYKWLQPKKSKSADTSQKVQYTTPSSAEETLNLSSNSEKPITNDELTGTPFRIVNIPDKGWFITLGMQRVTAQIYPTRKEAIQPVQERDWNFLCNVIVTLIEQVNQIHQSQQNQQQ